MSLGEISAVILLALGIGISWLSCIGLLVMRNPYDRLHAAGPGSILAPTFITAAILVHSGFSPTGIKAILIMLTSIFTSPIMTHAIGRAARVRETGQLEDKK